ncbi:MAG: RHS repeat-associated core domain-containing protein, partial [bacterium]
MLLIVRARPKMRLQEKIRTTGNAAFTLAAATAEHVKRNRSHYDESASGARYLNTPRLVADSTGTVVWRNDNAEPFGDSPANEDPSGLGTFEFPLRFHGQYADNESNLAYNVARDYDPGSGRYVQSDPIGLLGGLNTYLYVGGDPTRRVDPEGLFF